MDRKTESRIRRDWEGSTLIEYLASRFTYLSRADWLLQIAAGRISLNDLVPPPDGRLAEGDLVAFDASGIAEPEVDASIRVMLEDEDFLIVEKSGSLPCHPSGPFFKHSLWFILMERYGATHIATRLDRETSGLVLVCKRPESARLAQSRQAAGTLHKGYLALVHGEFPSVVSARGFLARDLASPVRRKRLFLEGSQPPLGIDSQACDTLFTLVGTAVSGQGPLSLVRAEPLTGRNHQIRATLLSLGFPLVGDKLYGVDEGYYHRFAAGLLDAEAWSRLILPNQALHCAELSFPDAAGHAIVARSEPPWLASFPALRTRP